MIDENTNLTASRRCSQLLKCAWQKKSVDKITNHIVSIYKREDGGYIGKWDMQYNDSFFTIFTNVSSLLITGRSGATVSAPKVAGRFIAAVFPSVLVGDEGKKNQARRQVRYAF